jgi:hypothetical protein
VGESAIQFIWRLSDVLKKNDFSFKRGKILRPDQRAQDSKIAADKWSSDSSATETLGVSPSLVVA